MVYTCVANSQYTFTRIVDDLIKPKTPGQLCNILSRDPDLIYTTNSNGQSLLHFAALHKNQIAIKDILCNCSLPSLEVSRKCNFGFTTAHMLFLSLPLRNLSPKLFYESLIEMNSEILNSKQRTEITNIGICLTTLAVKNNSLVKSSDGMSIYALVVFKKCHNLKKIIVQNFSLSINDVIEISTIKIFLKMELEYISRNSSLVISNIKEKTSALESKLAVFIKHGVSLDYSAQQLNASLEYFYFEPQNCYEIDNYFKTFLDVVVLHLVCLYKCIGLTHYITWAHVVEVMHRIRLSFVHKDAPKHYNIQSLFVILILYVEMHSRVSIANNVITAKNILNEKIYKAYSHINIVSFFLHRIWLEDKEFVLDKIAFEVLNFVKCIALSGNNQHGYEDISLIITTNNLYTKVILILYLLNRHTYYVNLSEIISECFQITLKSSKVKENLLNVLLRPAYFSVSFSHFSIDIESVIQFMIDLNVCLNIRDCWSGYSALHQAAISYPQSEVTILYLLDNGAYPFSLDLDGNLFYHDLPLDVKNKILRHDALLKPWSLQTQCNFKIVSLWPNLEIVKPFISPHIYRFLLLHTKPKTSNDFN